MSKIYCYLAGPVTGESKNKATAWRDATTSALASINPNIIGVTPVRYETVVGDGHYLGVGEYPLELAAQITAKNRLDVKRCDILLAFLPTLSIGTLQEIGWATAMDKPVIVISPMEEVRKNPVLMGSCAWIFDARQFGFSKALETITGLYEVYC